MGGGMAPMPVGDGSAGAGQAASLAAFGDASDASGRTLCRLCAARLAWRALLALALLALAQFVDVRGGVEAYVAWVATIEAARPNAPLPRPARPSFPDARRGPRTCRAATA